MPITTVLFDLDGTLLPMDQEIFTKTYFKLLAQKLAPHGYEPQSLIDAVWAGTKAMVKNDGSATNETVFWQKFRELCGDSVLADKPILEEFYEKDFENVRSVCGFNPDASFVVAEIQRQGLRTALATNPLFPSTATESRIRWAGLCKEDFEFFTTYENSCCCKPNPDYYRFLLQKLGTSPEECLMVGNDVTEDMIAETVGMHVFLLTDCMINKENKDISIYPRGNFRQLPGYIEQLRKTV